MAGYLPSIVPRDSYTLWYNPTHLANLAAAAETSPSLQYLSQQQHSTTLGGHINNSHSAALAYAPRPATPGGPNATNNVASRHPSQPLMSHEHSTRTPAQQPLSQSTRLLAADEATLEARKSAIRRFGAGWIRPPGVTKTLQAMMDEAIEKAEQEAAAARERAWAEEREAARQAGEGGFDGAVDGDGGVGEEEGEDDEDGMGMERDLDGDVPEADAEEEEGNDDDEGVYEDEDDDGADLVADDDEGMDLVEEDEDAQTQHNLDDSIPEAGSYEHTDTEIESSSDTGPSPSFTRPRPRPILPRPPTITPTGNGPPSSAQRQPQRQAPQAQFQQPQEQQTPPPVRPLFTVLQGVPGAPPPQLRFGDSFAGSPSQALDDSLMGDLESSMVEASSPTASRAGGRGAGRPRDGWRRSPRGQPE